VINADQFDELEVADLLYKVLNMYMEQAEVVEAACHAIFALKDLNHRLGDVCKVKNLLDDGLWCIYFTFLDCAIHCRWWSRH
jgi:hypothetical protein